MLMDYLNHLTATLGLFYVKLHQMHWYVTGHNFITLHEQFEAWYDETTEDMDTVAERILALGGQPVSTLAEFSAGSWINEAPYTSTIAPLEMVAMIRSDYETLAAKIQEGLDLSDEENDAVTNDMLTDLRQRVDKRLWMLNAYLK